MVKLLDISKIYEIKEEDLVTISSLYYKNLKSFDLYTKHSLDNYDKFISENFKGSNNHVWLVLGYALNKLLNEWSQKCLDKDKSRFRMVSKILLLNRYNSIIDDTYFELKIDCPKLDKKYQEDILNFQNIIFKNKDILPKIDWNTLIFLQYIKNFYMFRDYIYYKHVDLVSNISSYVNSNDIVYNLIVLNQNIDYKNNFKNSITKLEVEECLKNQLIKEDNDLTLEDYKYWKNLQSLVSFLGESLTISGSKYELEKSFQVKEDYIQSNHLVELNVPEMEIVVAGHKVPLKVYVYIMLKSYLLDYMKKNDIYLENCNNYKKYLNKRLDNVNDYLNENLKKYKLNSEDVYVDYYTWILEKVSFRLKIYVLRIEAYYKRKLQKETKNFKSFRGREIGTLKDSFKSTKDIVKLWIKNIKIFEKLDKDLSNEEVFEQIHKLSKTLTDKEIVFLLKKWKIPITYWDSFNESYKIKASINMSEKKAKLIKF